MNAVVRSNNIADFGLILRKREQRRSVITKLLASGIKGEYGEYFATDILELYLFAARTAGYDARFH